MSIYASTARFDTGRALTEDEMRKVAPSIFAWSAHESRSERFQPIPTIEILRGLSKEGFVPVGARQATSRTEGKAEFTKHLIRLRRIDDGRDDLGRPRRVKSRAVTGIDQDIRLNKALWLLGEEMAKLKGAR